jgi:hypothetical protein
MQSSLNRILFLPLIIVILSCAACTSTSEQKVAAAGVDADGLPILSEEQKEAGIVCVREPVIGTRISKKSCTTAAQREANQRAAQADLERTQRMSKAGGPDT